MGFKQGTRWWYASAEHRKGVGHKVKCATSKVRGSKPH